MSIYHDFSRSYNRAQAMAAVNARRRMRVSVLPLRRASDPQHGTMTAYQRGCGCDPCCRANTEAQRAKRKGFAA